jgi:hypothetical protein
VGTRRSGISTGLLVGAWIVLTAAPCLGQVIFDVSLDTTPLQTAAGGPFSIDFQMIDAGGVGDANNTANAGSFQFGAGGSPMGSPSLLGGATGDLSTQATLTDSSPFNDFAQPFTAGDTLHFRLNLTNAIDSDGSSDQFAFSLLDGTGTAIPTLGPGNSLLTVDLASGTAQSFATAPGADVALGAPLVVQAVPEPGALACFFAGAFGLIVVGKRRR